MIELREIENSGEFAVFELAFEGATQFSDFPSLASGTLDEILQAVNGMITDETPTAQGEPLTTKSETDTWEFTDQELWIWKDSGNIVADDDYSTTNLAQNGHFQIIRTPAVGTLKTSPAKGKTGSLNGIITNLYALLTQHIS